MDTRVEDGIIRVGGDARQRFFDSRGYGRPDGSELVLARVEAAHLLYRGDLDSIDGMGFREFVGDSVRTVDRFATRFLVYADLRERGFYLAPARSGWPGYNRDPLPDFTVFERGENPGGTVAHRLRVVSEREQLQTSSLPGLTLAIVDEESEVTYFECEPTVFEGQTEFVLPDRLDADLLDDRVICWDPPVELYESAFFGRPISGRDVASVNALQLSLVEAGYLAKRGVLTTASMHIESNESDRPVEPGTPEVPDGTPEQSPASGDSDATDAVEARGRAVEGDRFSRRLAVYSRIRESGAVAKTGFKFGADFRVYDTIESVDSLPHSRTLVRVVPPNHRFHPRELALDVRLAGGVRKRMVFTLAGESSVESLSVGRLTP